MSVTKPLSACMRQKVVLAVQKAHLYRHANFLRRKKPRTSLGCFFSQQYDEKDGAIYRYKAFMKKM